MDTAYVERAHGGWDCWTYRDGRRVRLLWRSSLGQVQEWCRRRAYKLVVC